MTTNHQRAVETLNKHWGVANETGLADETECCVKALEEAGLLMPDLPKPTSTSIAGYHKAHPWTEWDIGDWVVGVNMHGGIYTREDNDLWSETVLTDEARGIALALLAAANYAEEEQI